MKLSVICLSYNRPYMINQALRSIQLQTCLDDIQVIVVDDASNDETIDVIKSYKDKLPKLVLLQTAPACEADRTGTNRVSINVNAAISWMYRNNDTSKYTSYLCDDDIWYPTRCAKMMQYLDIHDDIDLVYHYMTIYRTDNRGRKADIVFNLCSEWNRYTQEYMYNIANVIDHCSFMHRTNYLYWATDKKFKQCSDYAFLLGMLNASKKFGHIPEYLARGRKVIGDSLNLDGVANGR